MKAGARAPERYEITIANGSDDPEPLDLSTVTAAVLRVRDPLGVSAVWATTVVTQTSNLLVLRHIFSAAETTTPGRYTIDIDLTVPDGFRRTSTAYEDVVT